MTDLQSKPSTAPDVWTIGALPAEQVSLIEQINTLLRHRRTVLGIPVMLLVLVIGISLVLRRTYTVTSTFMPVSSQTLRSSLAGFAAQLGLNIPSQDPGQSPNFYASYLASDLVLRALVETPYDTTGAADSGEVDLVRYYRVQQYDRPEAIERAIEKLDKDFNVEPDLKTNLVTLEVRNHSPGLALAIARRAIAVVNRFNLEQRRTQASAERQFLEGRLHDVEADLRSAEGQLEAFLVKNRTYNNSPELTFAHDRLQREVDMEQQVYTSLAQVFEQAKLDEVRNTPLISVVQPPVLPARPNSRHLLLRALLSFVGGGILGIVLAYLQELARRVPYRDPESFREFERLRSAAGDDVRRLASFFSRRSP
jgi:uncharacterized protein involved in exopolysaccharide biosynthesis